jgi:hypothetical protein
VADSIQAGPPTETASEHAENDSVAVEVEVNFSGDFSQRVRLEGTPEQVLKVAPAAFQLLIDTMKEAERRQNRKRFMVAASIVVFSGAALSLVGLMLDFANVRNFNTRALFTMGVWLLTSRSSRTRSA